MPRIASIHDVEGEPLTAQEIAARTGRTIQGIHNTLAQTIKRDGRLTWAGLAFGRKRRKEAGPECWADDAELNRLVRLL